MNGSVRNTVTAAHGLERLKQRFAVYAPGGQQLARRRPSRLHQRHEKVLGRYIRVAQTRGQVVRGSQGVVQLTRSLWLAPARLSGQPAQLAFRGIP